MCCFQIIPNIYKHIIRNMRASYCPRLVLKLECLQKLGPPIPIRLFKKEKSSFSGLFEGCARYPHRRV